MALRSVFCASSAYYTLAWHGVMEPLDDLRSHRFLRIVSGVRHVDVDWFIVNCDELSKFRFGFDLICF